MKLFSATALFCLSLTGVAAQTFELSSPGGQLSTVVNVAEEITYTVEGYGKQLIIPSRIGLELYDGRILGLNPIVLDTTFRSVNDSIQVLNGKNRQIPEIYNELIISLQDFDLIFRAYNEGIAYRFETYLGGEVIIRHEIAEFNFAEDPDIWFGEGGEEMIQWERSYYPYSSIAEVPDGQFAITPCLLKYPEAGVCIVVAESDLHDYPGMYVLKAGNASLKGKWAEYPKRVQEGDYEYKRVLERYDYIARTDGTRLYPWRVLIVSDDDKDLLNNELIYALARPRLLEDTDWIVPGKSAWEWWHDAILEGVPFPSGPDNLSLELYKYYVDFAAAYGLEYVTLDAGWNSWYVPQLCAYAADKGVKIILWYYFNLVVIDPAILNAFKSYGAAGVKVDLIERDDQLAIQWFEFIAKECAKRELVVTFHGCAKPTGLQRAYPNILNFEAVRGAECTKWDYTANPNYHLQFPFMRMLAGTLDYTPGSLRNRHYEQFIPVPHGVPYSIGTRTHEVAMYVIYDQTLAYLCDAPTMYEKHPGITSLIASIPTTWDRTVPLAGKVGEYAVVARNKGDEWFVAAMTNLEARNLTLNLSFLEPEIKYKAIVMRDTNSSDVDATSSKIEEIEVTLSTVCDVSMARGGGWVMHIKPAEDSVQDVTLKPAKEGPTDGIVSYYDPADDTLMISGPLELTRCVVYDITGRKRKSLKTAGDRQLLLPMQDLEEGFYLVTVGNEMQMKTINMLKF
ncbi:MAG: glycoside hydrolase family 97 protein [Bacteroidales bacterium]|nr:glycoside hydrolase family 97 protein [Bacteroidales bacterium]MBN2698767.1 glycoside hydrolase family 97 protein [Bacteroidales bacterium]